MRTLCYKRNLVISDFVRTRFYCRKLSQSEVLNMLWTSTFLDLFYYPVRLNDLLFAMQTAYAKWLRFILCLEELDFWWILLCVPVLLHKCQCKTCQTNWHSLFWYNFFIVEVIMLVTFCIIKFLLARNFLSIRQKVKSSSTVQILIQPWIIYTPVTELCKMQWW